ncbi:MAG: hypothetical protein RMY31_030480 [Dendronalium sp. ChiSLP03b]
MLPCGFSVRASGDLGEGVQVGKADDTCLNARNPRNAVSPNAPPPPNS